MPGGRRGTGGKRPTKADEKERKGSPTKGEDEAESNFAGLISFFLLLLPPSFPPSLLSPILPLRFLHSPRTSENEPEGTSECCEQRRSQHSTASGKAVEDPEKERDPQAQRGIRRACFPLTGE